MLEFELILPCYNESKSLEKLVQRAVETAIVADKSPEKFQLVLVENGSTDDSQCVLSKLKLGPYGPWFRVVSVSPNQGYGNGIWAGLRTTTAPYVGWSHADQQCDLKDPFRALEELEKMAQQKILVKGHRYGRNWKDQAVSWIFQILAGVLLGSRFSEINAQPKVFERSLLQEVKNPPKNFAFDLYVLYSALKSGYKLFTIPVSFPPRVHGASRWAATFFGRYKTILGIIRYMWELSHSEGRL